MPPNPLQPESSLYDDHSEESSLENQSDSSSSRSDIRPQEYSSGAPQHHHSHHHTHHPHKHTHTHRHHHLDNNEESDDSATTPAIVTPAKSHVPSRAKEVDELLSKELYQLTFDDRNAINEEIHGVRCLAPEETPELIRRSLVQLQEHLNAMTYKPAYDKAQAYACHPETAKTSYVNTLEFRLKFLRCELFDAAKAAVRLIKYLDLMVEMYGLFALQRKIQLTDFSKHEMQILRAGYFQMFPFRDRSGRRVLCIVGNMGNEYDPLIRVSPVL